MIAGALAGVAVAYVAFVLNHPELGFDGVVYHLPEISPVGAQRAPRRRGDDGAGPALRRLPAHRRGRHRAGRPASPARWCR